MDWSDWIEHDGKGCPCWGQEVEMVEFCVRFGLKPPNLAIAGSGGGKSWDWANYPKYTKIVRYRIRKPKGMAVLREIVASPERELEPTQ